MRQACWEYVACTHANLTETGQQFLHTQLEATCASVLVNLNISKYNEAWIYGY